MSNMSLTEAIALSEQFTDATMIELAERLDGLYESNKVLLREFQARHNEVNEARADYLRQRDECFAWIEAWKEEKRRADNAEDNINHLRMPKIQSDVERLSIERNVAQNRVHELEAERETALNALPALLEDYRATRQRLAEMNSHGPEGHNVTNKQFIDVRAERDALRERVAAFDSCNRARQECEREIDKQMKLAIDRGVECENLRAERDALRARWARLKAWAMAHQRDMLPGQEDAVIETMTELEARDE